MTARYAERTLSCMDCGSEEWAAIEEDAAGYGTTEGEVWTYCKACDIWTAHAPAGKGPEV